MRREERRSAQLYVSIGAPLSGLTVMAIPSGQCTTLRFRSAAMSKSQERMDPAMAWDALVHRARADLLLPTEHGDSDVFLWEHSFRVATAARTIMQWPDVQPGSPDETVVTAVALYHDAGWAVRVRDGDIHRREVLLRPPGPLHFEQGAMMLEKNLAKLLKRPALTQAAEALLAMADRQTGIVETRIVSDANHLDEFGMLSLWTTVRRGALEGKGVQSTLETWRRRQEYRFWEARLADSFHFPAVRAVAERRLSMFEQFMSVLDAESTGEDIQFRTV